MIIESHLRIGNLVSYLDDIIEVYQIERNGITDDKFEGFPYEEIEPIPLTEEWLRKFGLDEKWFRRPLMFHRIGKGYNVISNGHKIAHLDYVHQLQNLYFCLTGEELTLKN